MILRPSFCPSRTHVRYWSTDKSDTTGVDKSKSDPETLQGGVKPEERPTLKKMYNLDTSDLQQKHLPKQMSFEDAREAAQKAYNLQRRHLDDKIEGLKAIFSGQPDTPRTPDQEWYYKRVSFWMKRYENFVGLTEVKAAQARVVESEKRFIEMQEKRRESQQNITEVQKRIKDLHLELEKTHRGEDRYLVLVTQEHTVLKEEKTHLEEFKFFEKAERECFSALSNAVRDSHEKERAQAEKTKYWSVLGSIIGTCLGILGTTINNRLRMKELRRLVQQNSAVEEIQEVGAELSSSLDSHEKELSSLTVQVETILNQAKSSLDSLNKMDGVVMSLQDSSSKINTKFLEDSLTKVQGKQESLSQLISNHEKMLDEKIEAIKSDIFVQNTNVGKLAHIQLKDREKDQQLRSEREVFLKKSFEFIHKQYVDLQSAINSYSKDIDDKIKDVRSLLLVDQGLPKFENKLLDRLSQLEKSNALILKQVHTSTSPSPSQPSADSNNSSNSVTSNELALILESHHNRTRQTVVLSTIMVAVLTPVAVYAVNHVL